MGGDDTMDAQGRGNTLQIVIDGGLHSPTSFGAPSHQLDWGRQSKGIKKIDLSQSTEQELEPELDAASNRSQHEPHFRDKPEKEVQVRPSLIEGRQSDRSSVH